MRQLHHLVTRSRLRRVARASALATLVVAVPPPASAADHERGALLARVDDSRSALFTQLAGLSEARARWKSAPERWSILECLEHIVLAEESITSVMMTMQPPPVDAPPQRVTDEWLLSFATDRTRKFDAPGAIRPTGRFATLADARAAFDAGRARVRELIVGAGGDLRGRGAFHPALGRYLDGMQWALLVAGHVERHTLQIQEVRATPGFPVR